MSNDIAACSFFHEAVVFFSVLIKYFVQNHSFKVLIASAVVELISIRIKAPKLQEHRLRMTDEMPVITQFTDPFYTCADIAWPTGNSNPS